MLCEDVNFLRSCKKKKVIPNFIKIGLGIVNSRSEFAKSKAEELWLDREIKFTFKKLSDCELKAYGLHSEIVNDLNKCEYEAWTTFECNLRYSISSLLNKKRGKQSKKLKNLIEQSRENNFKSEPEFIPDFVVNESDIIFSETELNLLNKGLKFTPTPKTTPVKTAILDIESAIKFRMNSTRDDIRRRVTGVLDSLSETKNTTKNDYEVIKHLKEKDCVYVKADKGNKLVIMNKDDYESRMFNLITECSYKKINRDPLPKMIRESDALRQKIGRTFGQRLARKLKVPNPNVAKMYGLPKIHKSGNKMRQIVSNINSPDYKIAKWLVSEIKKLPPLESLSVKNSLDFAKKLENVTIKDDECLVSFDVCALFPSIPVDIALTEFENYLRPIDIPLEQKQIYIETARVCMSHSFFLFRDSFYKVESGTNMGNPLSPLISELFMSMFELRLRKKNLLPSFWWRYVDDVAAIVKKDEIMKVLNVLNSQFPSIEFTHEIETNGELSFLDLILKRKNQKIEIGVYHKPTNTNRTITRDSHCSWQHKTAAYHSMVHRLCRLNLSINDFKTEYEHIKNVAKVNGYKEELIDVLIKKHSDKIEKQKITSFFSQNRSIDEKPCRVALPYIPQIMNGLTRKFQEHDLQIVYTNQNKLSNLLGSTKDRTDTMKKSGIYSITCENCERVYYGQTKRNILTRYKEHKSYVRFNQGYRSAIASHALENEHNFNQCNVRLEKEIFDDRKLDAYESFFIQSDSNAINLDNGNIDSCLISRLL